jgi:hypothetical protein
MNVQNLVLEIGENESAADVQTRLNKAAGDGFFLVNVVGRLAFLRTTVMQKKPEERRPLSNVDGKEDVALSIIRDHVEDSCTKLEQRLAEAGIKRSVNWIGKKRLPMRAEGTKLVESVAAMTPVMSSTAVAATTGLSRSAVNKMRNIALTDKTLSH